MKLMTQIRHIMSRDPVAVQKDKSVYEAVRLMNQRDIDCLIVTENFVPVGIFTTTDLRVRVVGEGRNPKETPIHAVATKDVKIMKDTDEALLARRMMAEHGVKHMPIVDGGGLLVGMLSVTDLVGSLGHDTQILK